MSVVTLQIWFATSFHPGKKETLVGMTWRLINGEITEGFHPYSAGSVKNSGVGDFKALERMIPKIKNRILKQQISPGRVDLQIYSNNISLVYIFQNLVLPPTDKQILNTFRLVQEELKKFHSYEFGWIERKSNPAVKPLREWIKSNKGYGPEVPSVEEINAKVSGNNLRELLINLPLAEVCNSETQEVNNPQADHPLNEKIEIEIDFLNQLVEEIKILKDRVRSLEEMIIHKIDLLAKNFEE